MHVQELESTIKRIRTSALSPGFAEKSGAEIPLASRGEIHLRRVCVGFTRVHVRRSNRAAEVGSSNPEKTPQNMVPISSSEPSFWNIRRPWPQLN